MMDRVDLAIVDLCFLDTLGRKSHVVGRSAGRGRWRPWRVDDKSSLQGL